MSHKRPRIILGPNRIAYCDALARERQDEAVKAKRRPGNGAPTDYATGLRYNILGTRCEAAAKLYLNPVYWNRLHIGSLPKEPDLAGFVEVRSARLDWHHLKVRRPDPVEWAFLLVGAWDHPVYEIIGWLWGPEAKLPQFLCDPDGRGEAYFVEQKLLHDPAFLLEHVRRRELVGAA